MPWPEFATAAALLQALADMDTILIEVRQREPRRPEAEQAQGEPYSGKKRHPVNNTVIASLAKTIIFLGRTLAGHVPHYPRLKEEFPPEEACFEFPQVLVDLAYQGFLTD